MATRKRHTREWIRKVKRTTKVETKRARPRVVTNELVPVEDEGELFRPDRALGEAGTRLAVMKIRRISEKAKV